MNYNEISDIISSSTMQILDNNKETFSKKFAILTTYPKTSDEFKETLLDLFASSIELGAMASVKTLIELGYLEISQ